MSSIECYKDLAFHVFARQATAQYPADSVEVSTGQLIWFTRKQVSLTWIPTRVKRYV